MKAIFAIVVVAAIITAAGGSGGLAIYTLPVMAWAVLAVFAIQCMAFIPAYLYQTERYYDLIGSMTYIGVVALALLCRGDFDSRTTIIAVFIVVWALRLGSFLFRRISQDGGDSRFDKIKPSALLFLRTWLLQALWVTVTAGAALAAITSIDSTPLTAFDGISMALWLAGFLLESIADRQKRQFRAQYGSTTFIRTGLWALSRHPNYFGEIVLWAGIALLALPNLQGWQYLTMISPVFVYVLLTRISGVKLLEYKSDRRWGDDPDYVSYKQRTPELVPRWPGR